MEEPTVVVSTLPLWERLLTIVVPLVGGALAVVGGMWLERRKAGTVRQREHLKEIQAQVLRPAEAMIRSYFLRILGEREANIELRQVRRVMSRVGPTEPSARLTEELAVVSPDVEAVGRPSIALYECSRKTHYSQFMEQYERLMAEMCDYNRDCLEYVQWLAQEVQQRTQLPAHSPSGSEHRWVRADALALHIYLRQLVARESGLSTQESVQIDGWRVEFYDHSAAVHGVMEEEANRAIDAVRDLENDRVRFDRLQAEAERLRNEATGMAYDVERLLHASSLKGKCELLKA